MAPQSNPECHTEYTKIGQIHMYNRVKHIYTLGASISPADIQGGCYRRRTIPRRQKVKLKDPHDAPATTFKAPAARRTSRSP